MAGLLDFLNSPNVDPGSMGLLGMSGALSNALAPQPASRLPLGKPSLGYLIGQAAGGYGNGYGQGLQQQQLQAQTQGTQIQNQAGQLANLNALQQYNFWASALQQPTISATDLQKGNFSPAVMQKVAASQTPAGGQGAPSPVPGPSGPPGLPPGAAVALAGGGGPSMANAAAMNATRPAPGMQPGSSPGLMGAPPPGSPPMGAPGQGAPQGASPLSGMPYLLRLRFAPQLVNPLETQAAQSGQDPDSPQVKAAIALEMSKTSGMMIPPARGEPGYNWNAATNSYIPMQTGINALGAIAGAEAAGKQPYALGQIAATGNQARLTQGNEATLKTGIPNAGVGGPAPSPTGGPAPAPTAPGSMAPPPKVVPLPPSSPGQMPSGNAIQTPKGTLVPLAPSATEQLGVGTDEIKASQDRSNALQANWNTVRPTLEQFQSRLQLLADTLKATQSAGFNAQRADLANKVSSWSPGLAAKLMSEKDVGNIQTVVGAQTLDVLGQLKTATAGSKMLNSEFVHTLDTQYGPDLNPTANLNLISQAMGGAYQSMNMIDDWGNNGAQAGYRSAESFQNKYLQANPIKNFIDFAKANIGQLKGMGPAPNTKVIGGKTFTFSPQ